MRKIHTEDKRKTIEFPTGREISRKEAVSNRRKTYRGITVGTFLVLFTVLYVPSLLNWVSGAHIAQDVIRNGIIEEYIRTEAVLIRDEYCLAFIHRRAIYPEIHEGEDCLQQHSHGNGQ